MRRGLLLCCALLWMADSDAADPIRFQSTITYPLWSPDLPEGGMGGSILRQLSKAAGVPYSIDYLPVARFRQSDAPYIVGDPALLLQQRPRFILPIAIFGVSFFYYTPHHEAIDSHGIEDFKGHTLGVMRGTVEDKEYFVRHGVSVEEGDSPESLLRKLKKGRLDACILTRITGLYTIRQLFPGEQDQFAERRIETSTRPVAIMIASDVPGGEDLAKRYRQALGKMLHSPEYRRIVESYYGKHGIPADWFEQLDKFRRQYAVEGAN